MYEVFRNDQYSYKTKCSKTATVTITVKSFLNIIQSEDTNLIQLNDKNNLHVRQVKISFYINMKQAITGSI